LGVLFEPVGLCEFAWYIIKKWIPDDINDEPLGVLLMIWYIAFIYIIRKDIHRFLQIQKRLKSLIRIGNLLSIRLQLREKSQKPVKLLLIFRFLTLDSVLIIFILVINKVKIWWYKRIGVDSVFKAD
jgi:hypothetical protein